MKEFKKPSRKATLLLIGLLFIAGHSIFMGAYTVMEKNAYVTIYNMPLLQTIDNDDSYPADVAKWNVFPLCIASDEFAAAQQPRGIQFWEYINATAPGVFKYARLHNIFTSSEGDRRGAANAGGDVVQDNGSIWYNWTRVDTLYDTLVSANITPFVEIGFMPRILSRYPDAITAERRLPENFTEWNNLITAFLHHIGARYGNTTIETWRYEVWNEPDAGSFWKDEKEDYFQLYNETAITIKAYSTHLRVGGPAMANDFEFFEEFLRFCDGNSVPLDFISFHSKGSSGGDDFPLNARLKDKVEDYLDVIAEFPNFDQKTHDIEYFLTEADPIVGSHKNKHDEPIYAFRDTEYYPSWFLNNMMNLLQLQVEHGVSIHGIFSHNILFPWEARTFYGTRGFLTPLFKQGDTIQTDIPGDIPLDNCSAVLGKPIFTAAQMVSHIAWNNSLLLQTSLSGLAATNNHVNAMAWRTGSGGFQVLVAHQEEQQDATATRTLHITLDFMNTVVNGVNVVEWRIDATHNNAFRAWQAMGSPETLTDPQISALQQEADLSQTDSYGATVSDNKLQMDITLQPYTSLLIEITPV